MIQLARKWLSSPFGPEEEEEEEDCHGCCCVRTHESKQAERSDLSSPQHYLIVHTGILALQRNKERIVHEIFLLLHVVSEAVS